MKKITFLAAAALVSAGLSAQTVQKWAGFNEPDSASLYFPWSTMFGAWCGEDDDPLEVDVADAFTEGNIALFNDDVYDIVTDPEWLYDHEGTTKPTITLRNDFAIGGIIVDNSALTYRFTPESTDYTFHSDDETATLTKRGDGALYTDVQNNLGGGVVLEGGTIARYTNSSVSLPVFGSKIQVAEGADVTVDMKDCGSDYALLGTDIDIPEGSTFTLETSRYTAMTNDASTHITGSGVFNYNTRGDRNYWGNSSKAANPVDWTGFSGTINLRGSDTYASGTGATSIIFPSTAPWGKGAMGGYFDATEGDSLLYNVWLTRRGDLVDSLCYSLSKIDFTMSNNATLAVESNGSSGVTNITLVSMKSLNADETTMIGGYYKDSNPQLGLIFGSDNNDCHLDGVISGYCKGGTPWKENGVALFKEGTGTCYITNPENLIYLGVEVWEGKVLFNNPNPESTTATGQHKTSSYSVVTCRPTGTIGGFGTIGGHTTLYGTMEPGSNAVGTLRIDGTNAVISYGSSAGYYYGGWGDTPTRSAGNAANLYAYAGSTIDFEAINSENYDKVLVQNEVRLCYDGVDGQVNINLAPRDEWSFEVGDTLVLLETSAFHTYGSYENTADYFNFTVSPDFGTANFALEVLEVPAVYVDSTYEDFDSGETVTEQVLVSAAYAQLRAVCTAAGSGSAEPDAIESTPADDNSALSVYPNPAVNGQVTVAVAADKVGEVSVYNSAAQLVKSVATSEPNLTLDVSDLSAGIYYVRVVTADKAYTQKLIVK
ncbi:MAG: T9SS type A sorting domain-containing protein [Porphyromonadaceae bacterium]|nr:T9SS type A sorting domain-containing protein [Porphyromonadaceae bacterium]